MHPALSDNGFILKRYGRISAGTYRLYGLRHRDPLLYIDESVGAFPEPTVNRNYEDEEQLREVLTLTDVESTGVEMEVADAESGQSLGSIAIAVDDLGDHVEGTWSISDAENSLLDRRLGLAAAVFAALGKGRAA